MRIFKLGRGKGGADGRPATGEASAGGAKARAAAPKGGAERGERTALGKVAPTEAAADAAANRWPATNAARAYTIARAQKPAGGQAGPAAKANGKRPNTAKAAAKWEAALDLSGLDWATHFAAVPGADATPRRIVQFWDKAPPDEIRTLIDQVSLVAADTGYEHVVYTLESARARIAAIPDDGVPWLAHFDDAFHPAMQADIFRVLELYHHGGTYIDADMTLARPIPYAPPTVPLFAQWTGEMRTNIANWFLSSPPGHPLFAAILSAIAGQLADAAREPDGRFAKVNLLKLTGPAIVARAVEDYLAEAGLGEGASGVRAPAGVMPVGWCHTFVMPARRFLANPPQYKREGLHWKREAAD